MLAPGGAAHLLVEQVNVELAAGDHGYPELSAELVMQLAQRAHEQLPVRHHSLVAGLGWRVRPQGCTKVMLCTCRAAAAVSRSPCNTCSLALSRPQTAWKSRPERIHPQFVQWLAGTGGCSFIAAQHLWDPQFFTAHECSWAWHNAGTIVCNSCSRDGLCKPMLLCILC